MSDEPPNCARRDWGNLLQQILNFLTSNEFNKQKDHINNRVYPIFAKIMGQVSKSNIYWLLDTYLKPFIHPRHMVSLVKNYNDMDYNIFEMTNEEERNKGISQKEIQKFIELLKLLSNEDIYLTSIPSPSSMSLEVSNKSDHPDEKTGWKHVINERVEFLKNISFVVKEKVIGKVTETAISGVKSGVSALNSHMHTQKLTQLEGLEDGRKYLRDGEWKIMYDLWKAFRHSSKIALKFLINDPVNKLYYSCLLYTSDAADE